MSNFRRFAGQMLRDHRSALVVAMIFALISAGGLGAGLIAMGPIMHIILSPGDARTLADLALEHNADAKWGLSIPNWLIEMLPDDPLQGVGLICGGLLVLTVLGGTANFIHQYLSQTITTKVVADVRRQAYETVIHMPLARVIQRGPSEFVARIIRDSAELQRGLIALVSKSVTQVTKGIAGLIAAIYFDWRLTIIAVIVAPILGVALRKLGKRIRRGTRGSLQAQENLLRAASETLQGLRAVKVNSAEKVTQRRFDIINADVVKHELRIRTARAISPPLVESIAVFAFIAFFLVAASSIIAGTLPLKNFVLALGSLGVAGASFRPLAGLVNEIQASAAPADRLVDVLIEPIEPKGGEARLTRHEKSIEFNIIMLTYPGAAQPALERVSLTIEHGQRVAIVGPNGSGKTTLVSLLPRLLTPDSGRVLIDGKDIDTVTLGSLRTQIGVVTQETVLLRGSVAENIAFGLDGISREQIIEAAKKARAHDFISALSGGYEADLAEQGASLSGGQRQRLAIARVILRDPSILILDEATSQIDAESEAQINAALAEFCRGRTALIIAHRLATVLNADRIVVLEAGRIVDQGTHNDLLARCDVYRRLTETQLVEAG